MNTQNVVSHTWKTTQEEKRKVVKVQSTTWLNLENITLPKRKWTQNIPYYMIPSV